MVKGTSFCFDSNDNIEDELVNNNNEEELDFMNFPGVEDQLNNVKLSFEEQKEQMEKVSKGIWKKVLKAPSSNAKSIDFSRDRVTYHRNLFMEDEPAPFDSTYLNGKPDEIGNIEEYLEGLIEALSSMKEGESSQFIISPEKMFGSQGCMPRVMPNAEILAELMILKVDEIGNEKRVNELDLQSPRPLNEAKELVDEGRLRAKDNFINKNYAKAIQIYQKVVQIIELAQTKDEQEYSEKMELKSKNLINLALSYNMNEQPKKAIETIAEIEKICNIDKESKVLFIKGKALRLLGEYKEALIALKKAQHLKSNDKAVLEELEKLNIGMANYNEVSKKMAKYIFNSS